MQVFKDPDKEARFLEDGFVVLKGFLTPDEVKRLACFYDANPLAGASGFHATSHSKDLEYKRKVHAEITSVAGKKANDLINGHRSVTSSFTVKESGADSFFDYHLDWSMVDENITHSLTLWSPLVDTNETNGCLKVLRESHKLGFTIRSGPGLFLFPFDRSYRTARYDPVHLPMKAGDAIIYDHRIFHGSGPNLSGQRRVSFNHVLFPTDAVGIHYTKKGRRKINMYEVDDDFFNRYDMGEMPENVKLVKTIRAPFRHIDQPEINALIKQ